MNMIYKVVSDETFTEEVTKVLAQVGWEVGIELAQEKGAAPIMNEEFEVNAEMLAKRPEMKKGGHKIGDKIKGKVLPKPVVGSECGCSEPNLKLGCAACKKSRGSSAYHIKERSGSSF